MMKFVTIRLDIEELLAEVETGDLIKAARERDFTSEARESAMYAISQIRAGKTEDAIATLERAFLPAWEDTAACEARYREVMGRAA